MKKLRPFLYTAIFLFALLGFANAQTQPRPATDPEKIYLFDANIRVFQNSQIQVTETITLNVKHQQIRRGIYRDLPSKLAEGAIPLSLTLDGSAHPFFTEHKAGALRVNFGDDNFISAGPHTYVFTYLFTGAVNFYKNYDELYWNVTGNGWDFVIDKARVHVTFPTQTHVQTGGISTYTGAKGAKSNHAIQTDDLTYETTRPLFPREGLTIAIPFDKGTVQPLPLLNRFNTDLLSWPVYISLTLSILLFFYFIMTWLKIGKDPAYVAVTQYAPPPDISPAFMHYVCALSLDTTTLACALLDLSMKGHLEIKEKKDFLSSAKAELTLKQPVTAPLPSEEKTILQYLFPLGSGTFLLNSAAASTFENIRKDIKKDFEQLAKIYIISNTAYVAKAGILLALLGILPFALSKQTSPLIFTNVHFAVFFLLMVVFIHHLGAKTVVGLGLTAFYALFWIGLLKELPPQAALCQLLFVVSFWGFAFYATLIRNVTPAGKELFAHIYGFKKYMKTAEVNRVAASNPAEAEKIFCDFLPFAFALGLENLWMKKFEKALSQATLERCTAHAGGVQFISSGLTSSVRSSAGRSGSHGGGHSGGGHGGGGGGGR